MKKTRKIVNAQCGACGGTGLYDGFAEPEGVDVICINCGGTGCATIGYVPFTGRKEPKRIPREIKLSKGPMIFSCGPVGSSITYDEFKDMDEFTKLDMSLGD